jgi:hypothetical protein
MSYTAGMNKTFLAILIIFIAVAAFVFLKTSKPKPTQESQNIGGTPSTSMPSYNNGQSVNSVNNLVFSVPKDFGLATSKDQIPKIGYIPSCNEPFDYCIYYKGTDYTGTNFESAGVKIQERKELSTEDTCLNEQPLGFEGRVSVKTSGSDYKLGTFKDMSNAAAGHSTKGNIYRIFNKNDCYEIETRIGQTNFQNYEPGTINEFTESDSKDIESMLNFVIKAIKLKDTGTEIFN